MGLSVASWGCAENGKFKPSWLSQEGSDERGETVVSIPQTCFRVGISIGRVQDSVENLQVLVFPLFILSSQKASVGDMEL